MIRQTAIALALAAAAVFAPVSAVAETPTGTAHYHPGSRADQRITFNLFNKGITASDVMVDGKVYTVDAHHVLTIKAPVGTVIYAVNNVALHRRGEAVMAVSPDLQNRYRSFN